jgi:hypothetical protein
MAYVARVRRGLGVCAALLSCLITTRGESQVLRGEVPSWVTLAAVPVLVPRSGRASSCLLRDWQVRVGDGEIQTTRHSAYAVLGASGTSEVSTIEVEREPNDRVIWHFARRVRGASVEDLLPSAHVRVIQPEAQRVDGVFDGRLREVTVLEDIRVGDILEIAYTLHERPPPSEPRYAARYPLGSSEPMQRVSLRVEWPAERKVAFKAVGANVAQPAPNAIAFVQDDVPAYTREDDEPDWFDATPRLELSEYADWGDVARSLALFYPAFTEPPNTVRDHVQAWTSIADPDARMAAAVRFVQDEIRYLGIEDGELAFIPRSPDEVLRRRYGDCKDKSYLLVTLLRALGFEASPALVSVRWERAVEQQLPSPLAFDHAIVQTRLGDKQLWIDATRYLQRGSMRELSSLRYGRALVLRENEAALQTIPVTTSVEPDITITERFDIRDSGASSLTVRTSYRGEQADRMRARAASQPAEQLQSAYQTFYGERFETLRSTEPIAFSDDERADRFSVEEAYAFDEFWNSGEQSVVAWSILEWLPKLGAGRGKTPLKVRFPLKLRHVIELHDASGWETVSTTTTLESDAFSFRLSEKGEDLVHTMVFELDTKLDHIAPAQLERYRNDRQRLRDQLDPSFISAWRNHQQRTYESRRIGVAFVALLSAVLGVWGSRALLRRRRKTQHKRDFLRGQRVADGDLPQSAIELRRAADAIPKLEQVRCCRRRLWADSAPVRDTVFFGGATLAVYRLACPECGRAHRRYFKVADDNPE